MRDSSDARRLRALIPRLAAGRVLVIGDLMLDEFIWGRVDRISPEAPVPVVRVAREDFHLGGAANVVHNIRALGGQATACGIVGNDTTGRRLLRELHHIDAGTAGVVSARGIVTVHKTRIIAHNQQVVRFDREQVQSPRRATARLTRFLQRHLWDFDAVVVSDYGKGVVTSELLQVLSAAQQRRPFCWIVDPKRANFGHYRGATLVTPNALEAADAAGIEITDEASLRQAGARLLERWDAAVVLITRGEHGMTMIKRDGAAHHFPAVARQVYDVTGAGDTVVATCGLALAAGASLEEAAALANHAAGVVVGKIGTATVSTDELRAAVDAAYGLGHGRTRKNVKRGGTRKNVKRKT